MSILYDCFYNSNITLHVHYFVYIILHACIYIYIFVCCHAAEQSGKKIKEVCCMRLVTWINTYIYVRYTFLIHFWVLGCSLPYPSMFLASLSIPCRFALLWRFLLPRTSSNCFRRGKDEFLALRQLLSSLAGRIVWQLSTEGSERLWTALVASCGDVVSLTFADVLFA